MKYLIGAACVAIIAASGVYLWTQYQKAQRQLAWEQNAPYRHCDFIYSKIAEFHKTSDYRIINDFNLVEEQKSCDKLLGIKRASN